MEYYFDNSHKNATVGNSDTSTKLCRLSITTHKTKGATEGAGLAPWKLTEELFRVGSKKSCGHPWLLMWSCFGSTFFSVYNTADLGNQTKSQLYSNLNIGFMTSNTASAKHSSFIFRGLSYFFLTLKKKCLNKTLQSVNVKHKWITNGSRKNVFCVY